MEGHTCTSEMIESENHSQPSGPENDKGKTDIQKDLKKIEPKKEVDNTVPFYKLFSFADSLDHLLMFVGTIAAVGNGISMPLMTLIFGLVIDAFGRTTDTQEVVHEVSKVLISRLILQFLVLELKRNWYTLRVDNIHFGV